MAETAKKPTSDTASTSIGLPARPSYFRRLSALFGGGEVETAQATTTGPTDLSASSTANGRVVSLRGSYTPPQAAEPWMKRKPGETETGIPPAEAAPLVPVTDSPPVPLPEVLPPTTPATTSVPTISQVIPVTQVIEPELFDEKEIGAIQRREPEKAEIQLPHPVVSTVLTPLSPLPENEVPGTEDYTLRRRAIETTLLRVLPESIHFENEVVLPTL